ncbi:MAG: hypothetical protein GF307_07180 [candidate division Zixibacteria bacterium]|nr:hypothetical protein [candidate division Zixibacteria bacterium]
MYKRFIYLAIFTGLFLAMLSPNADAESEYNLGSRLGIVGGTNAYTIFKVGMLDPEATSGGLLLGLESGTAVDEVVSAGLEVDFWRKVFEKKITVGVDTSVIQIPTTTAKVLYKHSVYYVPLLATLRFSIPVGIDSPFSPFLGVSGGYTFSYISYDFKDDDIEEGGVTAPDKGWYTGWNWRIFGGAGMALGSMSRVNLGLMYNGAKPSKSEDNNIERELNLNGFGIYVSISLLGI